MVYFDYAASCYTNKNIMDVFVEHEMKYYPHPDTYKYSIELRKSIKRQILSTLNMENHEVIFTSGGTEANNLGILGFAKNLESSGHFITSTYEHSSIGEVLDQIETMGHEITRVTPRQDGRVHYEDVVSQIKDNTVMVCIMAVNNEIGIKNNLEEIADAVKQENKNIVFFSDFVQGLGKIQLPSFDNIDMISISSHKIYGLKAKGALIKNKDVEIKKLIHGGVLENNMRSGSQSVASEVAFGKAIELCVDNIDENIATIKKQMDYLIDNITKNENIHINIVPDTNVVNIYVDSFFTGDMLKKLLFENNIIVSTKSACSFAVDKPNYSLSCLGIDGERSKKSIRVSISHHTKCEEIDYLCETLFNIISI